MKIFTFIYYVIITISPLRIVLDVTKTDRLNLTDISSDISVISLKINKSDLTGIEKVFVTDESIFFLQRFTEDNQRFSNILEFDLSGSFKGKLDIKDPKSQKNLLIVDMLYDDTNNQIFVIYSTGYGKFDLKGNPISFSSFVWMDENKIILHPFMYIFKGNIWFEEVSKNNDGMDIKFNHSDLDFQSKEVIRSFRFIFTEKSSAIPALNLSSLNNDLYVSFKTDNIIYKVNKNNLTPVFILDIKGSTTNDFPLKFEQKIFGKFVINRYWRNFEEYDFIYDSEKNVSYNVKYSRNSDRAYVSGIKDDIFNTGYFKFSTTNRDDYIFFIKYPSELKGAKIKGVEMKNPVLFLVKLKLRTKI